jgi:hypothetical protein
VGEACGGGEEGVDVLDGGGEVIQVEGFGDVGVGVVVVGAGDVFGAG